MGSFYYHLIDKSPTPEGMAEVFPVAEGILNAENVLQYTDHFVLGVNHVWEQVKDQL